MRYVGRLTEWHDEKGYGFVTPNGGGDRAFVHIKAFGHVLERPVTGNLISYELKKDERNRLNAASVRFVTQQISRKYASGTKRPRKTIAILFLIVLMLGWLTAKIPPITPIFYSGMSLIAALLYGVDKSAAKTSRQRIPETTLHFVGLLGGWPGALFAQDVFHHKSKKEQFQHAFFFTVIINVGMLIWLLVNGTVALINQAIFGI